jgi:hypothetical protein
MKWVLIFSRLDVYSAFRLATISTIFHSQIIYPSVKSLDLGYDSLYSTPRLNSFLKAFNNQKLMKLVNLTILDIKNNRLVTDEGIQNLNNLACLKINKNKLITDEGIKNLTNLRSLQLANSGLITNSGLKRLTNLTDISLLNETDYKKKYKSYINNDGISHLSLLSVLNIGYNKKINDEVFKYLTNVKYLSYTNLTHLEFHDFTEIGLNYLINLVTRVHIDKNYCLFGSCFQKWYR